MLALVIAGVAPRMNSASEKARWTTLLIRLHSVRRRIDQFRRTHDGHLPAEGQNSEEAFLADLRSLPAEAHGQELDAASFSSQNDSSLPPNPYTQLTKILVVPDQLRRHHYSGSGQHGWVYSSTTGEFRSNLSPELTDDSGRLINQH